MIVSFKMKGDVICDHFLMLNKGEGGVLKKQRNAKSGCLDCFLALNHLGSSCLKIVVKSTHNFKPLVRAVGYGVTPTKWRSTLLCTRIFGLLILTLETPTTVWS